jgi:hypothetical protein
MADRFVIKVQVKASGHFFHRQVAMLEDKSFQARYSVFHIYCICQHLYTVAGGNIEGLLYLRDFHYFYERPGVIPAGYRKPLPDFQGGSFVIHADKNNIHGFK